VPEPDIATWQTRHSRASPSPGAPFKFNGKIDVLDVKYLTPVEPEVVEPQD
jgi:hypothetical protein